MRACKFIGRLRFAAITVLALAALSTVLGGCAEQPVPMCRGNSSGPRPTAEQVCARLQMINCPVLDCTTAYNSWQMSIEPTSFARVTACYMAATTCTEVDECGRACGNGGAVVAPIGADAGTRD